jgi:hypothetical protein
MKQYEIWSEGYAATGQRSGAVHMGTANGNTFRDACDNLFNNLQDRGYYNSDRGSYWACKLFDNEADARNSFG